MDVSYTVNVTDVDVKQQTKTKPIEHQHSEIPLILLLKIFKSVLCDHTVYFHIVHHDNKEYTHMCSHHLTVNTWRCYDMVPMCMAWLDWWQKHAIYVIHVCESILYVTTYWYSGNKYILEHNHRGMWCLRCLFIYHHYYMAYLLLHWEPVYPRAQLQEYVLPPIPMHIPPLVHGLLTVTLGTSIS